MVMEVRQLRKRQAQKIYVFCMPDGSEISRFRVEYQLKKLKNG